MDHTQLDDIGNYDNTYILYTGLAIIIFIVVIWIITLTICPTDDPIKILPSLNNGNLQSKAVTDK